MPIEDGASNLLDTAIPKVVTVEDGTYDGDDFDVDLDRIPAPAMCPSMSNKSFAANFKRSGPPRPANRPSNAATKYLADRVYLSACRHSRATAFTAASSAGRLAISARVIGFTGGRRR